MPQVSADAIGQVLEYRDSVLKNGTSSYALTGARCLFLLNGNVIGWGREWSLTVEITQEPMVVVGMFEPVEWTPMEYRVSLTTSFFRLFGFPLHRLIKDKSGNVKEALFDKLTPTPDGLKDWILSLPELDVELYAWDSIDKRYKKIGTCYRAKVSRYETRFAPREFVAFGVSFNAIYYVEEND